MKKALIIVESPTKIKTLKKFLGRGYEFESSLGHIRDLPKKGFGIDVENDFEPIYEVLPEKKETIKALQKKAKECDVVYLAPDPDREGEAIAWHIASILPKNIPIQRVTFNAITKASVSEALKHPREIDASLVDAQQARRLLDRLVGYTISPILQRRIQTGKASTLSAGRVQSVALKLVVDREKEIEAFVATEYWNILALLSRNGAGAKLEAHLFSIDQKKIDKIPDPAKNTISIPSEQEAKAIVADVKNALFSVLSEDRKEKRRQPVPPFITSTLQQEASRHFGFSATRTMSIAQSLYEGVDLGDEGREGLITYMRTDSVRVEKEALDSARDFIRKTYGKEYLPEEAREYATKKSAQDAHEAIRPTNLDHPPEKISSYLTEDQRKLYTLIWRRFVASQMNPAVYDTVSYEVSAKNRYIFKINGSIIKFPGFLAVYEERKDVGDEEEKVQELPELHIGETLKLSSIKPVQSFTKPPPRFTEASLVKELEKSGIGRPSTYATIMNKIQSREYTTKERLQLKPTELGKLIAQMLESHFGLIMDVHFTAEMENELDKIAEDRKDWKAFLRSFWKQLDPLIEKAKEEAFVPKQETDKLCPECGAPLQKIWAKGKYFYGCSRYPECSYSSSVEGFEFDKSKYAEDFDWEQPCPLCGSKMTIRHGRFGAFLGCSKYPECRGIVNIPLKGELIETAPCPAIGCDGTLQKRRSRFGKPFFSCSNYPDCDVIGNSLDEIADKYRDHPKTAYVKKAGKKGAKSAAKKGSTKKKSPSKKKSTTTGGYTPSKELAQLIGVDPVSRPEATKKIWDYIKAHNLQDPKDKKMILPDRPFAAVFGKDPIHMMKLGGALSKHLIK